MLDSLVCTVDIFDIIKLKKRKDKLVNIEMHGRGLELLPYEQNNAVKAAESFINCFGTDGADIVIYKKHSREAPGWVARPPIFRTY